MNPWLMALLSGGSSILGGLLNRQTDPMEAYRRTGFLSYGQNTPTGFANAGFADWMRSPAFGALQQSLFGQQTGFQNQLQSSLANRGLLNSGLGNVIGSLGGSLYGGNLAQAQGQQYQQLLAMAPQIFALRGNLAGSIGAPRPSFSQGLGAGLQGLGGFGLNYLALGGQNGQGGSQGGLLPRMGQPGFQFPLAFPR